MRGTRSLHLIDLENLCASGLPTENLIERVWRTYRYGVPNSPNDQYVVGSSHLFAVRAWFVLPSQGVQRRARPGTDGGELSLLIDLDLDHTASRFDRLVIGSGDGMFASTARAARERALHVHQVSGLSRCSRALAALAHTHSRLRLTAATPAHQLTTSRDAVLAA